MNRKLFLFVILAFVFNLILLFIHIKSNIRFEKVSINLPQFAPALAFFATILLFRDLFRPIVISFNRIVLVKTFLAIIIPIALFTLTYYIGILIGIDVKIQPNLFPTLITCLFGLIIGSIGEEIGWRSFLQPALELKYSRFTSSIIVGLIWGIWHIIHYKNGLLFMIGYVIFTISISIVFVYLLKGIQNNLITSTIFHTAINASAITFFYGNFTNIKLWLISWSIWLIAAIILTICERKYYMNI
ncbi:lysostaphin resistance A-like protein [Treponema sp. R80B11-R83G3]